MRDLKDLLEPLTDREMPDRWDAIGRRRVEPLPEPARSRVSAYLMSGAVALLAIAVIAWLAPLGGGGPEVASDAPQPPAWLVEGAYRFAYGNGDLAPDSAEWVLADADAVAPAVGLQSGDPGVDRYLVVLHGDFTAYGASPPTPASLPTGHVAVAAFDADSHDITDWGVGDHEVDVPGLSSFALPSPADTFVSQQGWSAAVPPGWQTEAFSLSRSDGPVDGAMFANRDVPGPTDAGGAFPQASGIDFPSAGVALVISTMRGVIPGTFQPEAPPLSRDDFANGSAAGLDATLDSLVFQGPDGLFVATIKTGSDASAIDVAAVDAIVGSLVFASPVQSSPATTAVLPSVETVVDGRFVVPVELDDGFLHVDPVPVGDQPSLTADVQNTLMASSDLSGKTAVVIGYGLITLQGAQDGQDAVHEVPGWIVFGWGERVHSCPFMTAAPSSVDLPSDGYVAVAILPGDGLSDFSYEARSNVCGKLRGPSIGMAMHVESIAWEQVGAIQQDQVKISYTLPPCGFDATNVIAGDAAGSTLTVSVSVPDGPVHCPAPTVVTKTVPLSGSDPVTLQHAPVGLVPQI